MNSIKQSLWALALSLTVGLLCACSQEEASTSSKEAAKETPAAESIKVGAIAGPETTLLEVAQQILKEKNNIDMHIVTFEDYATPNTALNDGTIDANMFQTKAYLDAFNAGKGTHLISLGETFVYPMGIYSHQIKTLADLKPGSSVAIPNDPSNHERGLFLLQTAGLIELDMSSPSFLNTQHIKNNPYDLKIVELDAAQLPRTLADVAIATINTNYALGAGLYPNKDALLLESTEQSYVDRYANIVAVKAENKDDKRLLALVEALHSDAVVAKSNELFKGGAIPAWRHKQQSN